MAVASDTQFHVLAVDDSIIDRKLIEKLLRTSCYQGVDSFLFFLCDFYVSHEDWWCLSFYFFVFAVTAVDSGNKALEFLGLQEEQGNEGFPSLSSDHHVS